MNAKQLMQLFLLSAIWGASFMFMRIAVPQLGPTWLLGLRLLSAALVLLIVSRALGKGLQWRQHWKHYFILGLFNTAIPFFTFANAAKVLPASLLSIFNSTAPLWGLLVGVVWRGKPITRRSMLGLLCGMAGVTSLVGLSGLQVQPGAMFAAISVLFAAVCYGIASSYTEFAPRVETYANAQGSMWAAVLILLPFMPFAAVPASWEPGPLAATLALGVVCTGLAYLMYFHLIDTVGAPSALTVGYLIPLWGSLWGWLFLDEVIGWNTLLGAGLVLTGVMLVTGFSPARLMRDKRARTAS